MNLRRSLAGIILALAFVSINREAESQGTGFSYFYRVYFTDKGANVPSGFAPSDLLSERALQRRARAGIIVPDYQDLPVWQHYIKEIESLGFTLHCTSKWLNTALFKTTGPADISVLQDLQYVKEVKLVKHPAAKGATIDKFISEASQSAELPPYDRPVTMLNGHPLHDAGYTGHGVLIAVLDGGFLNAEKISSLAGLRSRQGIKVTWDFVDNDSYVYDYHTHGTAVLSILAGQVPYIIEGTAPGADYLLLRTEDVFSETSAEEDYWAAGAEYADSAGADIISSSLGYFAFDDPSTSYKFSDLDGKTAFVTRAADFAASKGILVVNSAGNERNTSWQRIIAPADGIRVLAAGAVDGNGIISTFSSAGPSYDRRIKPDNVAMGVSVPLQTSISGYSRGNGTSFSCPVISGMAACLMQAVPAATNIEITDALHRAGDRYESPDSLYGYGIPDFVKALRMIQDKHLITPGNGVVVRPNPTKGDFEIVFREPPDMLNVEIFSASGVLIYHQTFTSYAGRSLIISALNAREQGIYYARLTTANSVFSIKVVKLSN